MSEQIRALIYEVIAIAKARGVSQRTLAESAGLTAVGLSKAKHRGDIRASLLGALGDQLDLELAFVPRRSKEKAAEAIKAGTFFRVPNNSEGED